MNVESEDLVHQFAQDWPGEFETSRLRVLVAKLTEENEQLRAQIGQQPSGQPSAGNLNPPRSYPSADETAVFTP